MQADNEQPLYQLPPIYAASEPCSGQAQQQECFSNLQGDPGSHFRASSAVPLTLEPPKGQFSASVPAPQPESLTSPWQQTPEVVATPSQPPSQPTQAQADFHLHSFGHQPLPAQPVPMASLQHHPTILPQQGYLPSGQWHPTGRSGMPQTDGQAYMPQSSIPATIGIAQPSRGASSGSARECKHTSRPDVDHRSGPWNVPPQLQPYAMTTPMCSSTAAPATSNWAVSHLRPQSLPLTHPFQASHPNPHPDPPARPLSQAQGPIHQGPHAAQGPHPSLPPRPLIQASHPFPGQGSLTMPASRPYSRCDHPSYAHLDLSRPLCLQQPPVPSHPDTLGSYSWPSHAAEDPLCLQQQPAPRACDQPSLQQQQPRTTVADAQHLLHQQPYEGSQQGLRRSGLMGLQAEQQGQGPGSAHAACHLERQIQPLSSTVDPADCTGFWPQSSWTPMGVLLELL